MSISNVEPAMTQMSKMTLCANNLGKVAKLVATEN
jgi:hypothetical protein